MSERSITVLISRHHKRLDPSVLLLHQQVRLKENCESTPGTVSR
jgi:hypothetical protein